MIHYKLTADYQLCFGENPAVLAVIDDGHRRNRRVAPVGVNGPLTAESFIVDKDDLEPIGEAPRHCPDDDHHN